MARLPKITVHSWHAEGPAYTVHHRLAGWRHRAARRAGEGDERVGPPEDEQQTSQAQGYLVFAHGEDEIWAFNAGYVYELTILVDGHESKIHIDTREEIGMYHFAGDVQLLERRALNADELESLLGEGQPAAPAEDDPQSTADEQDPPGENEGDETSADPDPMELMDDPAPADDAADEDESSEGDVGGDGATEDE